MALEQDEVEIYRDKVGEYRWRRKDAHNGNIVADGSEGYVNEGEAIRMAAKINKDASIRQTDGNLMGIVP